MTASNPALDPSALLAARQMLLEKRLQAAKEPAAQKLSISRRAERAAAPLSFSQQRLWFFDQLQPGNPAYNLFDAWRLRGPLDAAALEGAFNEIIRRHESLRTGFRAEQGQALQSIAPQRTLAIEHTDLRALPAAEREPALQQQLAAEARRPFKLDCDLLIRARLFRLEESEHVLIVTMHHIISDAWSLGVLYNELNQAYAAIRAGQQNALPDLPVQYADFASWQRETLAGDTLEKQVSFWKQQLAGAPDRVELPLDRAPSAQHNFLGALEMLSLPESLGRELKALSRREGVTLFMTLLAAFNALLHRYSHQKDLVVGIPVSGRSPRETENLIGFFVNTLPVRTDLSDNPPFRELLQRVRQTVFDVDTHQEVPFEKLVAELQSNRSSSHSPLFQVMFILQGLPAHPPQFAGVTASPINVDNGTSKFDLSLVIFEAGENLTAAIEYRRDLFHVATVQRMLRHFQNLLADAVAQPGVRISELRLLDEAERRQVLVEFNQTARPYPRELTWIQLFEAQVQRTPEAIALVVGEERFSYAELNRRVNRLAHHLRARGIGPESLVGLCCERTVHMLVGMLAILKAGGAYLPMDPNYPAERLAFMLQDAQAPLLLTEEKFKHLFQTNLLCLDRIDLSREPADNPALLSRPDNLAYVIYTSGSTGQPKGVALEHRSLNAFAHWAKDQFSPGELDGVLAGTSICFDLSVFELLVPLCWGGKIILAKNVLQLPELPAAGEVRLVNTVPSAAAELLRSQSLPAGVQVVNLAGEPLRQDLVDELYALGTVKKVYDLYGPTEDTVYSTGTLRTPQGRATIGRPLANKQVYILDEHLAAVPIGVTGQLYIGGDGLARGYLHRPELTRERFIASALAPGQRLYQTGDLGRYLPDGQIEFLGRADHQVKIRGFRIELGEMEAHLRQHPRVREAVVVAREHGGEQRLVAYAVVEAGVSASELRDHFKSRLPEYMVPSFFVFLDQLPLTPNGKIDRKALPAPHAAPEELEKFVAPRTATENVLAEIWCQLLDIPQVGIRDNYFRLGGHSLLAIRVISRIRDAFQIDLPMSSIFEAPTIEGLAARIEEQLIAEIEDMSDAEAAALVETAH